MGPYMNPYIFLHGICLIFIKNIHRNCQIRSISMFFKSNTIWKSCLIILVSFFETYSTCVLHVEPVFCPPHLAHRHKYCSIKSINVCKIHRVRVSLHRCNWAETDEYLSWNAWDYRIVYITCTNSVTLECSSTEPYITEIKSQIQTNYVATSEFQIA